MSSNRMFKIVCFSFFLVTFLLSGCLKQSSPVYYHTLASTGSAQVLTTGSAQVLTTGSAQVLTSGSAQIAAGSGQASTGSADGASDSLPNILLGPIRVASFLSQGQLVRQKSAYSLTLAEQHRWAGDLPEMITDILHTNLSLDLSTDKIYPFPDMNDLEGLQLEIHFLHFEADEKGLAKLAARWKVISTKNQTILYVKTSTYTIEPEASNYDGLARGLSKGLSLLSDEISKRLVSL